MAFRKNLQLLRQLPEWLWNQTFCRIQDLQADSEGSLRYAHLEADPADANLICSLVAVDDDAPKAYHSNGFRFAETHMPMWDIDFDLYVRETSPGKYHLAINKPISREQYEDVTRALVAAGIVQRGWAESAYGSDLGGCLRPPWINKQQLQEAQGFPYNAPVLNDGDVWPSVPPAEAF